MEPSLQDGDDDRVKTLLRKFEDQCKECAEAEEKLMHVFESQARKILEHVPIVEVGWLIGVLVSALMYVCLHAAFEWSLFLILSLHLPLSLSTSRPLSRPLSLSRPQRE